MARQDKKHTISSPEPSTHKMLQAGIYSNVTLNYFTVMGCFVIWRQTRTTSHTPSPQSSL